MSTHNNEENVDETMVNAESTAEDLAGCDDSGEVLAEDTIVEEPDSIEDGESIDEGTLEEADDHITEPEEETAELDTEPEDLAGQLAEAHDQLLRRAAEFENFRKRMNQDKQNAIEFANQSLLLDIIPIIDDFERAIQSAEASPELAELPAGKAMLEGIMMIEKRLTGQLENKWGLKRYNSVGEPFDYNIHEAMFEEKSPDIEEPVITEEFFKGYKLKDRVIRAAKVKVLMPQDN